MRDPRSRARGRTERAAPRAPCAHASPLMASARTTRARGVCAEAAFRHAAWTGGDYSWRVMEGDDRAEVAHRAVPTNGGAAAGFGGRDLGTGRSGRQEAAQHAAPSPRVGGRARLPGPSRFFLFFFNAGRMGTEAIQQAVAPLGPFSLFPPFAEFITFLYRPKKQFIQIPVQREEPQHFQHQQL